jgi:hypothetical protein
MLTLYQLYVKFDISKDFVKINHFWLANSCPSYKKTDILHIDNICNFVILIFTKLYNCTVNKGVAHG